MKKTILIFFVLLYSASSFAEQTVVPFTLEDRDLLIRIDARLNAIETQFKAIDEKNEARFDTLNSKIETNKDAIGEIRMLSFSIILGFISIFGFILWDRRSFVKPVKEQADDLAKENQRIIDSLKKRSKSDKKLAEALQSVGIF